MRPRRTPPSFPVVGRSKNYLTTTEVADLCGGVDLKTLYNWLQEPDPDKPDPFPIESFVLTTGRHRRFHPGPVIAWAKRRGYRISPALADMYARSYADSEMLHARRAVVLGLDVLLFFEHISWITVCIKHDIMSQGKTPELALEYLKDAIANERSFSVAHETPLPDAPPTRFIEAWKKLGESGAATRRRSIPSP